MGFELADAARFITPGLPSPGVSLWGWDIPGTAAENVLDFEEALALLSEHAAKLSPPDQLESVPLLEAHGRVLAAAVSADRDQPPFDRSARDGFAVRAAGFRAGMPLTVAGEVRAGEAWRGPALAAGQAIQIMTGAPVPAGADAVAMVEHVERGGGTITAAPGRSVGSGENIVPRGSEARAGEIVLQAGSRVTAAEIALAAACGHARLDVFRRRRVAILATGDELVELDVVPDPQQIRNSNSYSLAAMVEAAGGEPLRLPIARDNRDDLHAALQAACKADLILFSGGVSLGEYDLVEEILLDAEAEFYFTGVRLQPGKPAVFGSLPDVGGEGRKYFFGLPGNPISTQVTFHCFVEPFLRAMGGEALVEPRWVLAELAEDAEAKPGLTRLPPAELRGAKVRVIRTQGSGDLAANARANCHAELPPGKEPVRAGTIVRVLLR